MAAGGRNRRTKQKVGTKQLCEEHTAASESQRLGPITKLKLSWKARDDSRNVDTTTNAAKPEAYAVTTNLAQETLDNDTELPVVSSEPKAKTTRSGRHIKKPKQFDDGFVFGSELDKQVDLSSHTAPTIFTVQDQSVQLALDPSFHHQVHSSRTAGPTRSDFAQPATPELESYPLPTLLSDSQQVEIIDNSVWDILSSLQQSSKTQIELPDVSHHEDPTIEVPYTTTVLTQLYLVCFDRKLWDLCDLVADTWIRAFHNQRSKAHQDADKGVWRPNSALEARMRSGRRSRKVRRFDKAAPDYKLNAEDPLMDDDVTSFDRIALNTLYDKTPANCGARLLWADAMALAGDRTEEMIQSSRRRGIKWHQELEHDIMCTSLRMARRKLTLKIEEVTEGAWCKRYHEHGKHRRRCYRESAFMEKQNGEQSNDDMEITHENNI